MAPYLTLILPSNYYFFVVKGGNFFFFFGSHLCEMYGREGQEISLRELNSKWEKISNGNNTITEIAVIDFIKKYAQKHKVTFHNSSRNQHLLFLILFKKLKEY